MLMLVLAWVTMATLVVADGGIDSYGPPSAVADHWVIVSYDVVEDDPAMMQLLDTELTADAALQAAGVGAIDGNEVGQGVYDMYFFGTDREAMWAIIEPILDDAPAEWTKAELRDGLDDDAPIIVEP